MRPQASPSIYVMPAVKNTRQTRFAPVGVDGIVAGMKTTFMALLAFSLCLPLVLAGCGDFKKGFKKGYERAKKSAEERGGRNTPPPKAGAKAEPKKPEPPKVVIADAVIEKAIRERIRKPNSELTTSDLRRVDFIRLNNNGLTDVSELAKLTRLRGSCSLVIISLT